MIKSIYNALKSEGVLSINQRNAEYILKYNARHLYPIVDNKLRTKLLAQKGDIAVPPLYAVIENQHQVQDIESTLAKYNSFVVKPAHGAGGDGILVINNRLQDKFIKSSGQPITLEELKYHILCALSGIYSLAGHPDKILIEHRVEVDDVFASISYQGVPDIRIIVFLGYPAMAMVRLPTRQSDGKANLHQGAIGVGIDLKTGRTIGGVHHNELISQHPDTLNKIIGAQVPYWEEILHIAASTYELTGLGFLGVDIVLDKEKGPLMLELNARPGLNIQIANQRGLVYLLEEIKQRVLSHKDNVKERIQFSQRYSGEFSQGDVDVNRKSL